MYENEFKSQMAAETQEERDSYADMQQKCNEDFRVSINVEERYNRCIIFDGRKYHGAVGLYGNDPQDARLTLVGFFRGVLK